VSAVSAGSELAVAVSASVPPPDPFRAVPRGHAADAVHNQLASAILRGTLAVGTPLPPERVLADRFGVSRIIVRQAIHRLAEIGLVRVRQGGATVVLDPNEATDLRVIDLFYRLGPQASRDLRDLDEKQLLQGHAIVAIAALRAKRSKLEAVAAVAEDYIARGAKVEELLDFEQRYWRALAQAGENRLYILEVGWWYRLLAENPRAHHTIFGPPATRALFYRELSRRLLCGEDAAGFYMQLTNTVLGAVRAKSEAVPKPTRARVKRAAQPRARSPR
jgi:DNA-binding FadR family transcriptional regulator